MELLWLHPLAVGSRDPVDVAREQARERYGIAGAAVEVFRLSDPMPPEMAALWDGGPYREQGCLLAVIRPGLRAV